jgi:hypothetical protein
LFSVTNNEVGVQTSETSSAHSKCCVSKCVFLARIAY